MKRQFELDPRSDRYRVCPNCEKEFMTPHRTRKFCEDWCRNEYHNAIKRRERNRKIERGSLEWNVIFLSGLDVPKNGMSISKKELDVFGVDLNNYNAQITLDKNENGEYYMLKFGQCYLRRLSTTTFLLTKEINNNDRN